MEKEMTEGSFRSIPNHSCPETLHGMQGSGDVLLQRTGNVACAVKTGFPLLLLKLFLFILLFDGRRKQNKNKSSSDLKALETHLGDLSRST
jgi:hypothetical protein